MHVPPQLSFANKVDSGSIQNDLSGGNMSFLTCSPQCSADTDPLAEEMHPACILVVGFAVEVFTEACRAKMRSVCKIQN